MKFFEKPEIEVIKFEAKDVIATSTKSENDNSFDDFGNFSLK